MDLLKNRSHIQKILIFLLFAFAGNALAQLSPGDLSQPHASLEGVQNCSKCHGFDQKLAPDKCLSCHKELSEGIKAGKGLHANSDHQECGACHVEHQGKDYELVYWKGGEKIFNHALTGYKLEGKHSSVECRSCHKGKNIAARERFFSEKIDLNRTYLGLGQDCLSCHADEHRGQLSSTCLSCHSMAGWKPASAFDHSKAKYILTGKHPSVQCLKCHQAIQDSVSIKGYVKFTGLKFEKCLDCHKDVHENKLGQNCEGCHNTSGWTSVNQVKFDHSKTRYPLEAKHISVACEKCHLPGKPLRGLAFHACIDCHKDYHQGQFAAREKKGACEECHTVAGYAKAEFSIEDHQKTRYQLWGSHLAVPCDACHKKEIAGKTETIRFKYENTRCQVCHNDPHKGTVDIYMAKGGCEYCHLVESWRSSSFNHSQTKYTLEGRHKDVACGACHQKEKTDPAKMQFAGLTQDCQGCHEDIHRGQFVQVTAIKAGDSKGIDCTRCHYPASWKAEKFDHNRDSTFKLDGAHINLKCDQCHKPTISDDGKPFIKFKPLGSACSDCHGGKTVQGGAGKS